MFRFNTFNYTKNLCGKYVQFSKIMMYNLNEDDFLKFNEKDFNDED